MTPDPSSGFVLPPMSGSTPVPNRAKAERLVFYMIRTLRRRGAVVGPVSATLTQQLRQAVEARLSWTDERWKREDRRPEALRENEAQ